MINKNPKSEPPIITIEIIEAFSGKGVRVMVGNIKLTTRVIKKITASSLAMNSCLEPSLSGCFF